MSQSAIPVATEPRLRVTFGAQPMIEVETSTLAETELVEELIWQAMLARTSAPELSCAAEASNVREGGLQRYLFGPWVSPHLQAIAASVERDLSAREAEGAQASAAGTVPVIGGETRAEPIPVIGDPAAPLVAQDPVPVITGPVESVPVIGGAVQVTHEPAAPASVPVPVIRDSAPGAVAEQDPVVPVIGPSAEAPAPSPAAAWGRQSAALSEESAVGWTMPIEVQRELTTLRAEAARLASVDADRARLEAEAAQLRSRLGALEADARELSQLRARISQLEAAGRATLTGLRAGVAALEAAGL